MWKFLNEATIDSVLLVAIEQLEDQATNRLLIVALEEYEDSGTTHIEDVKRHQPKCYRLLTLCGLLLDSPKNSLQVSAQQCSIYCSIES